MTLGAVSENRVGPDAADRKQNPCGCGRDRCGVVVVCGGPEAGAGAHERASRQITVQSGARSFYVDGGQGVDTLVLNAASGSFELSKLTTGTTVFLQQGRAVMAAANVEQVKFTDKTVWLGATPGTMVTGGASNDVFRATSASDAFDGGAGIDTVVFSGSRAAYSLSTIQAGEWVVTPASGGADVLRNVERMRFDDAAVALDIQGHGGQAYQLYQAAFACQPDAKGLGDWIEFLDRGGSLE